MKLFIMVEPGVVEEYKGPHVSLPDGSYKSGTCLSGESQNLLKEEQVEERGHKIKKPAPRAKKTELKVDAGGNI